MGQRWGSSKFDQFCDSEMPQVQFGFSAIALASSSWSQLAVAIPSLILTHPSPGQVRREAGSVLLFSSVRGIFPDPPDISLARILSYIVKERMCSLQISRKKPYLPAMAFGGGAFGK